MKIENRIAVVWTHYGHIGPATTRERQFEDVH